MPSRPDVFYIAVPLKLPQGPSAMMLVCDYGLALSVIASQ
jgi:hypothetical protein